MYSALGIGSRGGVRVHILVRSRSAWRWQLYRPSPLPARHSSDGCRPAPGELQTIVPGSTSLLLMWVVCWGLPSVAVWCTCWPGQPLTSLPVWWHDGASMNVHACPCSSPEKQPCWFHRQIFRAHPQGSRDNGEVAREPVTTGVIPYVVGMSEDIRRICRGHNIRVTFRSSRTLRTMLSSVKDRVPAKKQSDVVYKIPCSCGKVYLGETRRRLETWLKEHKDACRRGELEKSAITEHAWKHHHTIKWEEMSVVDRASRHTELLLKEALNIQLIPVGERLNWDEGLET